MNLTSKFGPHWTKEYLMSVLTEGSKPILSDPQIINAFMRVDRRLFVPEKMSTQSYNDISIDLGNNTRIPKPTHIAQALTVFRPKLGERYLVVGSGGGYLVALLAFLVGERGLVFVVEENKFVYNNIIQLLNSLGSFSNIKVLNSSYTLGHKEGSPYDKIYVQNDIKNQDQNLLDQLKYPDGVYFGPNQEGFYKLITRKGAEDFEEEIIDYISLESN